MLGFSALYVWTMNSSGYGLIKMVSFYAKLLLLSTNRKLFFACFSPFYAKKGYQKILLMYKKVFYLEKIFKMRYSKCLYLMKQKSNSNFRKKNENTKKKFKDNFQWFWWPFSVSQPSLFAQIHYKSLFKLKVRKILAKRSITKGFWI